MKTLGLCFLTLLCGAICSAVARCENYEQVISQGVQDIVWELKNRNINVVTPSLRPLPGLDSGGKNGFLEIVKEELSNHDIRISGDSKYKLVAQMLKGNDNYAIKVVFELLDGNQSLKTNRQLPLIDDGKDIAEIRGKSAYFGPLESGDLRLISLKPQIENPLAYRTGSDDFIYTDREKHFGIGVRVGNQVRPFKHPEAMSQVVLDEGEEFELAIHNNTNDEVAVNLKVDGVNVFHFAEPNYRRPDGMKYKYWIIAPKTIMTAKGWVKNTKKQQRFRITPLQESAAVQAGIDLRDVGLITATFHATWEKENRIPRDEPKIERTIVQTVNVPVTETVEQTYTVKLPDGTFETRTRTVEVTKMVQEQKTKTAVGFGEEIYVNSSGTNATIGVARGTLAFRYLPKQ